MDGTALSGALGQQLDWVQAYSFMLFTLIYMAVPVDHPPRYAANQEHGFTLFPSRGR